METMLETTLREFDKNQHDGPPTDRDAKFMREYYETGCLCVLSGELPLPKVESDYVACLYFQLWCGCSRHHDPKLRYGMDYLRQKIENANGELAILEDNLQFLSDKKYHERLKHIARRMDSIILHLNLDLDDYSEEE